MYLKHRSLAVLSLSLITLSVSQMAQAATTTLRFWQSNTAQAESYKKEIQLFEKQNPDIHIELNTITVDQYTQTLALAFKSGSAPDIFRIPSDGITFKQVLDNNWMMPLNKWATKSWQSTFPKNTFVEGANVFEGNIYSAPFDGNAANRYTLYINNKVFRDAGLVDKDGKILIPKTWNDARKFAKQIKDRSNNQTFGYGIGFKTGDFHAHLQTWSVRASGGHYTGGLNNIDNGFNWKTGKYEFSTNPVWKNWFNHWFDMIEDGSIFPGSATFTDEQIRVLFAEGKFGMHISGPWVPPSLAKTNPNFTDYTIAPVPTYKGTNCCYYAAPGNTNSRYLAINNNTKNAEAAWKFFAFLHSKSSAARWVSYGDTFRIWPESKESATGKTKDLIQTQLTGVKIAPNFLAERPQLQDVKRTPITENLSFLIQAAFNGTLKRNQLKDALNRLDQNMNNQLNRDIEDAQKAGTKVSLTDFTFPKWNPLSNQSTLR